MSYMSTLTKERRGRDYMRLNFGGTSDWAVDLQKEGSGIRSGRPVYLDPSVYESREAKCEPPCVLVFPPSKLPETMTIDPGQYVTSLEYGANGPTTINGQVITTFVTRTTTITITIPAITIDSMQYGNVNITAGQTSGALRLIPSIDIDPITVRLPDGQGAITDRALVLPPWPAVTGAPPGQDDDDGAPPGPPGGGGSPPTTRVTSRPLPPPAVSFRHVKPRLLILLENLEKRSITVLSAETDLHSDYSTRRFAHLDHLASICHHPDSGARGGADPRHARLQDSMQPVVLQCKFKSSPPSCVSNAEFMSRCVPMATAKTPRLAVFNGFCLRANILRELRPLAVILGEIIG